MPDPLGESNVLDTQRILGCAQRRLGQGTDGPRRPRQGSRRDLIHLSGRFYVASWRLGVVVFTPTHHIGGGGRMVACLYPWELRNGVLGENRELEVPALRPRGERRMILGLAEQLAEAETATAKGGVVQRGHELLGRNVARARACAEHASGRENARRGAMEPPVCGDGTEADPLVGGEARRVRNDNVEAIPPRMGRFEK